MSKSILRQYFDEHSNLIKANDGVQLRILDPFYIVIECRVYNEQIVHGIWLTAVFKQPKRFIDAFKLNRLEEMSSISLPDLQRVYGQQSERKSHPKYHDLKLKEE